MEKIFGYIKQGQTFLIIIAIVVLFNVLNNLRKFLGLLYLRKIYKKNIESTDRSKITRRKQQLVKLLKNAGVKDSNFQFAENIGYAPLPITGKVFAYVDSNHPEAKEKTVRNIEEALGVYKQRTLDTINPFIWVETLIFLPRNIFNYLGVGAETMTVKIFQIVYWIISPLIIVYRDKIIELLSKLINIF